MSEILITLLKNTYSLTQLKHRLHILKSSFLKQFFASSEEVEAQPQDLSWLKSLPDTLLKSFNKDNIYKIFDNLEKEIAALKILTLYITFEMDENTLSEIGEMVRKTYSNQSLLLDFKYDPKLIAGAALGWNGRYRDYSLRAKIEERKLAILDSFKRFLR